MKIILPWFLMLLLLFIYWDKATAQNRIIADAKANIFGAGKLSPPAPGGGGGGVLPLEFYLDPCTNFVFFPNLRGNISCCNGGSSFNNPDGGPFASGATDLSSFGGISGIIHQGKTMFLAGVFLDDTAPAAPAPSRLKFTNNDNFTELFPELKQTFFIGDGLTGTGNGVLQNFHVPEGATRLFLGFADGLEFSDQPGYYADNVGQLTLEIAIDNSSDLAITNINPTNTTCGEDNGAISIWANGGCGQLAYSIDGSDFQTSNSFENLAVGSYTVFVQDNNGSRDTQMVIIESIELPPAPSAKAVATSCGESNGSILIDVNEGNFEFSINGNDYQQENVFLNLAPGDYTVFIKDEHDCVATDSVQIADSPKLFIRSMEGFPEDCGERNGGFLIDFDGGTGLIQISLNGGNYQNTFSFNNLPSGEHSIRIQDETECVIDTIFSINQNECPIFIPNVFSPNNDGINDLFKVYPHPDFKGNFQSFSVFDRWGAIVFYTQNFNHEKTGWDGTHKGKELGRGVYVYLIEYLSQSENLEILTGDIAIIK